MWEGESLCRLVTWSVRSYIMVTSVQACCDRLPAICRQLGVKSAQQRGGRNWQEQRKAGLVEGLVMGSDKSVYFPGMERWERKLQGRT